MWLNATSGVSFGRGPIDDAVKRTVKGTLRGRYSDFAKALRAFTTEESYQAWIDANSQFFTNVSRLRDLLVHGKWRRGINDGIECLFHDRQSVDSEKEVSYEAVPLRRILQSTDEALILSVSVVRVSGSLD